MQISQCLAICVRSCVWKLVLMSGLIVAAALPLLASTPDLSGTYTGDDGGIYYVQQSGNVLWWAGMSLDRDLPADYVWHRGLYFTNIFRGTISGNTITGQWADVSRGHTLSTGTLTLSIGSSNGITQLTRSSATGGFGATTWNQTDPFDDTKFNGKTLNIIGRMDAVHKNEAGGQGSLTDNLKTYRDQSVVYGRVVNEHVDAGNVQTSLPHIAYGPQVVDANAKPLPYYDFSQPARDSQSFACYDENGGNGDGDIDIGLNLDTDRLEDYFWTTGWGNRTSGPIVFSLKFGYSGDQTELNYGAYIHPEGIMYGKAGTCDSPFDSTYGYASLLPGWADLYSASILINGRPMNGNLAGDDCNVFIQPCPYLGGATSTNYLISPIGVELEKLLLSQYGGGTVPPEGGDAGTYVRITGALVVDCGHGITHPCYDDTGDPVDVSSNQNQEIHPIYSIDVINKPYRPEDSSLAGRSNLTGAWGGSDGSTYYVRQIGNTLWWLGMMRDRQPMQDGTGNAWAGCEGTYPSGIIGTCQLAPAFNANDPPCSTPGECWAFANVFKGTITESPSEVVIEGDWAGVPQSTSAGSTGGHMKFFAYNNKMFVPATSPSIFPVTIEKMYEPEDTTAPQSTLTIATPQYTANNQLFVSGVTPFTVTASDRDSGVQNIWYRDFPQGASAPAYTPVVGSTAVFNLSGADGTHEVDTYATDNGGNDESPHSTTAYFDNTAPVATITQPAATQYGHSDTLMLNYSVSDGSGSGVKSFTPKMDGQTASQFGASLDSGQPIYLISMLPGAHTFSVDSVDNVNNAGTNSVVFAITVTFDSLKGDVNELVSLGCVDNISQSLLSKISAAQNLNGKGQTQAAINTLSALINETQAQAGKHISTTCTDPSGRPFNPVQLLLGDTQYLQGTLGQLKPNPVIGSALNSNNVGINGVTVNLVNSSKTVIATATTDSVGLFYFADTSGLTVGANYTVKVTLPKGYKSSTPASHAFTWKAVEVALSNFVLN
jgi:SdrD B-like domain